MKQFTINPYEDFTGSPLFENFKKASSINWLFKF
jgi:hypothetical protein